MLLDAFQVISKNTSETEEEDKITKLLTEIKEKFFKKLEPIKLKICQLTISQDNGKKINQPLEETITQ